MRLFGETDYDAFQRLRKIEILTPEVNKGLRNDLKAALDKIDQQYLNEIVGGQEPGEEDTQNDLKVHEENTTIEELEVGSAPAQPAPQRPFLLRSKSLSWTVFLHRSLLPCPAGWLRSLILSLTHLSYLPR